MNVHQPSSDPFEWHRRAVAGEKPPIHDGDPQLGYYRRRWKVEGKYAPWLPASIFSTPDGKIVAELDGQEVDPVENWTWFANEPVEEEAYRFRVENGYWPDEPAPRSHNEPPEPFDADESATAEPAVADPELDILLGQANEMRETAGAVYLELTADAKQAIANRAMNVVEDLRALSKRIDALRKERKQPYLDAERALDAYFRDAIQLPLTIADKLANERIRPWKRAEEDRRRAEAEAERQRLVEEQRKRQAAEAERRAAEGQPPAPAEEEPAPQVEPERVMLGGGASGRRSGGRKVVTAKITDIDAVYQHFKEHADVKAVLQRLANAAIRKQPVPGAEKLEDEKL